MLLKPRARTDLAKSDVRDELVVYDFNTHQARCLNATAAAVFKRCDGTRTPRQIAGELGCDEDVVWMALAQLDEGALLAAPLKERPVDRGRRALLKKMALTAGLSIALPAVWSIVAPTPAYAASPVTMCINPNACMGGEMTMCCNNGGVAAVCQPDGTCGGSNSQCHGQTCG